MKTYNLHQLYTGSEALDKILKEKRKSRYGYSSEENLTLCNAIRVCLGKEPLNTETWDAKLFTNFVKDEFNNIPQNDVY
jgi:hypothetical protein